MLGFQHRLAVLLALLLCGTAVTVAQMPAPPPKLMQAMPLSDVSVNLREGAVSPDGTTIAWFERGKLCFFVFENQQESCATPPPQPDPNDSYVSLSWSPDGKTMVFTEDLFNHFVDSDIWTYDIASDTFEDRTDDTVSGRYVQAAENGAAALLDYGPRWNPVNGDLYFFRSTRTFTGFTTTALELMPLVRNEPKQIADYTNNLLIFQSFAPEAISPDGTKMAIILLKGDILDSQNGVYIISLTDGTVGRVMRMEDINLGLPQWSQRHSLIPEIVEWVGNGGLVVWSAADGSTAPSIGQAAYYVDLNADVVTPLADFTDIPDWRAALRETGDISDPVYRMPRQGVVTPDGRHYLYIGEGVQREVGYLFSLNLPPDGKPPVNLGQFDFSGVQVAAVWPFISPDSKHAAIAGFWLTLQPSES